MVKTSESTALLDSNGSPNCRSQASDDDAANDSNKQIKFHNGGNSSLFETSTSNSTGHLTVEKYILQLQQKDERIRTLKDENKRLRSTLLSKTSEFQIRVDELVTELERQAEIVKKLQNELAICRRNAANSSTESKKFITSSPFISPSFVPPKSKNISPSKNIQTNNNDGQAVDICAKLQSFCERNNMGETQQQQQALLGNRKKKSLKTSPLIQKQQSFESSSVCQNVDNNVEENENQQQNLIPFEQICKLISENPATLLPAAALIFGSASITTQQQPTEDEETFSLNEENELEEEKEKQNFEENNLKEEIEQEQQTQDAAEAAANLISFLMESTNISNNNLADSTPPTSSFASTSTFNNDSIPQQNFVSHRRSKSRRNSSNQTITETPTQRQLQQNLDFEEVMQRVIGEAMNGVIDDKNTLINETQLKEKQNVENILKINKQKITTTTLVSSPSLTTTKQNYFTPPSHPAKKTPNNSGGTKSNNLPHHHSAATAKPFSPEEQKLVNELEARIDANIVKLGNCHLNTTELAVQCTRLMREYSIGQRLFARTVMCKVSQSQGSLSELLSKPRPWNKLTDKGRDSFRRIFGWISDDFAIDLLCQLSPRKVAGAEKIIHPDPQTLIGLPENNFDGTGESLAAKVDHPTFVDNKKVTLRQVNSLSSNSILRDIKTEMPLSPQPFDHLLHKNKLLPTLKTTNSTETLNESSGGVERGGGRWRHDDIPKEKIIGILEAEKAKILEQETNNNLNRSMSVSSNKSGDSLTHSSRRGKSVSAALDNDCSINSQPLVLSKSRRQSSSTKDSDINQQPPRSLSPSHILFEPPFAPTQAQIEKYSSLTLDTEDIARRMKEFLALNAISQRQVGDNVVGLSQGSVSDMLTRPKAWNILTSKGREPFVRMFIFLEQQRERNNENEEENGKNERNNNDDLDSQTSLDLKLEDDSCSNKGEEEENKLEKQDDGYSTKLQIIEEEEMEDEEIEEEDEEMEERKKKMKDDENEDKYEENEEKCEELENFKGEEISKASKRTTSFAPLITNDDQPAVKRPKRNINNTNINIPLTTEINPSDQIDTADVARRIKESLSRSGLSQRAFGEHVLNMTSGCFSDLLTKARPWVMLGWKHRQAFQKMVEFLADPDAIERLRADERHRCEMNNALNALRAIAAVAPPPNEEIDDIFEQKINNKKFNKKQPNSPNYCSSSSSSRLSPCITSNAQFISSSSTDPLISATSTLQIVSNLANELGVNTPIGTILKKANSPNPAISNGVLPVNNTNHSTNKRKSSTPTSINNTISLVKTETTINPSVGAPSAKRLPRFQRTIITDRQKEALIFIYIHEQRPNSKLIEQLATKVGLQPRTVNNWFHNHRTRNKEKQVKNEGGDEETITTIKTSHSTTPTPAQVLSRALNATDTKTTKWFRELAELLQINNENNSNNNQDITNYNNNNNYFSCLSSLKNEICSPQNNKTLNEEIDQITGNNNSAISSPPASLNRNSSSSLLDRAIARMHSRISAEGV
ncbi:hypothetical protein ACQ4LE_009880 [Meloidogyne hapla]